MRAAVGAIRESGADASVTAGVVGGVPAGKVSPLIYDGGESAANINRATAEPVEAEVERLLRGNEIAFESARVQDLALGPKEKAGLADDGLGTQASGIAHQANRLDSLCDQV